MKDSAIVYRNFMEAVRKLPVEKQGAAYEAYMLYAMDGIEYEGDDYAIAALLASFASQIIADRTKYEAKQNRTKTINDAKKNTKSERNRDDNDTKSERNRDEIASDNVIDIVIVDPSDLKETSSNEDAKKVPQKRFVKPTLEEVAAYCLEKGYSVDAEAFISYYDSNGWRVGRNPMRDWKAATRNWHQREKERPSGRSPTKVNFDQRQDDLPTGPSDELLKKLGVT